MKRSKDREANYQLLQNAGKTAQSLRTHAPLPAEFKKGGAKVMAQVMKILDMSIGRKVNRTPVPKLRSAIQDLLVMSKRNMTPKASAFVGRVVGEIQRHEANVNTDRSFKPFMEVLRSELQVAAYCILQVDAQNK